MTALSAVIALSGCGGAHRKPPPPLRVADLIGAGTPGFAGDVNGDGRDDIVLSNGPRLVVVLGRRTFAARARVRHVAGTFQIRVRAHPVLPRCCERPPDEVLEPVRSLGDVDGDGLEDLGVGGLGYDTERARSYGAGTTATATAFVVFGRRNPASVDLDHGGQRVASVTTGLNSDESGTVSLERLPDGRILAAAVQQRRYPDGCGQDSHPLPVLTRSLSSVLDRLLPGDRISLVAGGSDVHRLHFKGHQAVILDATSLGRDVAVYGRFEDGARCPAERYFERVAPVAAFLRRGPVAHLPTDVVRVGEYGTLQVGDFNGDARQDLIGMKHVSSFSTTDVTTLRLGRTRFIGAGSLPAVFARLGPWPAEDPTIGFAGDVNRDGRDDLLVNTYEAMTVVFGAAHPDHGATRCRTIPVAGMPALGTAPTATGDVNGDGISDLLIGTEPDADSDVGNARIVFGPIQSAGVLKSLARIRDEQQRASAKHLAADPPICTDR
jgi:hypothetical protein